MDDTDAVVRAELAELIDAATEGVVAVLERHGLDGSVRLHCEVEASGGTRHEREGGG